MQEQELKKISGKLIEIDSKLDKDTFHISGGSKNINHVSEGGVGIQEVNVTFKQEFFNSPANPKIKLDIKDEIKIKRQPLSNLDKKALKIVFLILSVIISFLVYGDYVDIFYNGILSFLALTSIFYFISFIFILIFFLIYHLTLDNGTLKLNNDEMIFNFKNETIKVKDFEINGFSEEKNFFGSSYFIRIIKESQLNIISFYAEETSITPAITERLKYYLVRSS